MGQITKVTPDMIQVANNVTSRTVGNTTSGISLTFDSSGVITSASNITLSVANTQITGLILGTQIAANTITGDDLGQNSVSANNIASGAIEQYQNLSGNPLTNRNRIINGAMVIDQRNAGASVTPVHDGYTIDRYKWVLSQASKLTSQQSTVAPAGFINSMLITSTAATSVGVSDYFCVEQDIEGFNCSDLGFGTANAQTVTVSFWVRSSVTGTYGASLRNSAGSRGYAFQYTISSANTWEQKSVTIAGDTTGTWLTDNGIGIRLTFGLGVGSNFTAAAGSWSGTNALSANSSTNWISTNGATFYITGVQLEVGSVATPFERRPYGIELMLCQRYYQTSAINVPDTNCGFFGVVYGGGSTQVYGNASFKTLMRATPTVTLYDGATVGNALQVGIASSAATAANINAYGFSIVNKTSGNYNTTAGYSVIAGYTASIEL